MAPMPKPVEVPVTITLAPATEAAGTAEEVGATNTPTVATNAPTTHNTPDLNAIGVMRGQWHGCASTDCGSVRGLGASR
jgi:hypothetical protein